jgi:hypothetical protein
LVARQDIGDRSSGRLLENSHVRLCLGRHLKSFARCRFSLLQAVHALGGGVRRYCTLEAFGELAPNWSGRSSKDRRRLRSAYVQIFELFEAAWQASASRALEPLSVSSLELLQGATRLSPRFNLSTTRLTCNPRDRCTVGFSRPQIFA